MAILELAGSAGRIEAILDEPANAGTVGADGLLYSGHQAGRRAAVVMAHP